MSIRTFPVASLFARLGLSNHRKRNGLRSTKPRTRSFEPLERRELLSITWTGGGANNNWSTAANWNLGRAPVNGDDVVLAGTAQTSTNDDLTGLQLNSIEFQNSGFSIGGNNLAVTSGIKVDSGASAAAIGVGVALNGTVNVDVEGGNLTLSGIVSGSGGLSKSGAGIETLTGTESYTGSTTVNAGTLALAGDAGNSGHGTIPGSGALTINNGGTVSVDAWNALAGWTDANIPPVVINGGGTLTMTDGETCHLNSLTLAGGTLTGTISPSSQWGSWTLDGEVHATANSTMSATAMFPGNSNSGGFNVDAGVTLNVPGTLVDIDGGQYTGSVVKNGLGTLALTGANTYSGPTTINQGTITHSASQSLPSGWSDADIGGPGQAGSAAYDGTTWTVAGGGADIWNNSDQFNFASENMTGDGAIVAQVDSITNTDGWAKAGVMFRNDGSAGSAFVDMVASAGAGVSFQWRNSAGGGCGYAEIGGINAPVWVKLVRSGNNFSGYYSTDGVNWTQCGSTQTIDLNSAALAGLAVTAHNNGALNTSTFTNVSVTSVMPLSDADIGSPSIAGSASYDGTTWTVNGSGSDIWSAPDQFNFASEPLAGDGSIVAQITSQSDTSIYAKSGVMFRDSSDPNSSFVAMLATPAGPAMAWRTGTGSPAYAAGSGSSFSPIWLKLTRTGETVTGYTSTDGVNWTEVGSVTGVVAPTGLAGLAVCSHNTSVLGTSTFTHVAVTSSAPVLQPPVLTVVGSQAINDGQTLNLTNLGTFTGDPSGGPFTYTVSWGDGTATDSGTATINFAGTTSSPLQGSFNDSHTYADNGVYTVTAIVTDNDNQTSTGTFQVTVNDVAPIATFANNGPIVASGSATVSFAGATDPSPSDTQAGFHYSFALTQANLATSYATAGTASNQAFSFATPGTYTAYGRIFDRNNGFTNYQTTITVTPLVLYWDTNGSAAGFGNGNGSWDATTPDWTTSLTGTGTTQAWVPGAIAVFGGPGGEGNGCNCTITVSGTIGAETLQFNGNSCVVQGGTLTTLSSGTTIDVENGSATIASVIAGSGDMTKIGGGTLYLSGVNTLTGNITINQGTLQAGTATASTGALGDPTVARDVTVNAGATLVFGSHDVFGNAGCRPVVSLIIDGGVVTNNGDQYNTLGPVTLDGGTLTGTGGPYSSYQTYFLTGTVTVIGTTPSTISTSGPNSGIHLYSPTVFDVAVTGGSGPDLTINAPLIDQSGGQGIGSLTKTGAGTLAITPGDGLYSGGTTVLAGTVTGVIPYPNGLEYRYYTGSWGQLPNFNSLTPQAVGTDHNFDISVSPSGDDYGLQFTGRINVPAAGTYTFYTTSDDGSDLYIDGQLLVNDDGSHGMQQASGAIALSAGLHTIEVDYFQGGGGEGLSVQWSSSTFGQEAIPDNVLYHDPDTQPPTVPQNVTATSYAGAIALSWTPSTDNWGVVGYQISRNGQVIGTTTATQTTFLDAGTQLQAGGAFQYTVAAFDAAGNYSAPSTVITATCPAALPTGLVYRYYTGSWTQLPNFSTLTPQAVGATPYVNLTVRQQDTNYAIQFTGQLLVTQSGTYTFSTTSDDGSDLYIDGQLVVNNDGTHYLQEQSGTISLMVGIHTIEVDYFQGSDDVNDLSVMWSGPGIAQQTIPGGLLHYNPSGLPTLPPVPDSPIVDALGLQDPVLANLVQRLFAVNQTIDRNGMIQILEAAGTFSGVSAVDLGDLRTIVANAAALNMPGYVQALASNVVNSLAAGSSIFQLNQQVDVWFLGTDQPNAGNNNQAPIEYVPFAGTLYGAGGPSFTDTEQGSLGDCWLIASFAAVANSDPTAIENMFVNNGDGTYTVRFYSGGTPNYVTVDQTLAINTQAWYNTSPIFDGGNYAHISDLKSNNVLWVALAEKAYAEWGGGNVYENLDGGWPSGPLNQFTNNGVQDYGFYSTQQTLINAVNNHDAVVVDTMEGNPDGLPAPHSEALISYDPNSQTFLMWNPWGSYQGSFTYNQLANDCTDFCVTTASGSVPVSGAPLGSQTGLAEAAPPAPGLSLSATPSQDAPSQDTAGQDAGLALLFGGDGFGSNASSSQGNLANAQLPNSALYRGIGDASGVLLGGSVLSGAQPNLAAATTEVPTTPGRHLSARTARETDMALLSREADGFSSDWSPQTAVAESATLSPALVDALMKDA